MAHGNLRKRSGDMTDKEKAFYDWWEQMEVHKHLYNLRMAFDAGWEAAKEQS